MIKKYILIALEVKVKILCVIINNTSKAIDGSFTAEMQDSVSVISFAQLYISGYKTVYQLLWQLPGLFILPFLSFIQPFI